MWLAPAYVEVLGLIAAFAGTYLFARRLGLGQAASAVGGLGFMTCAFLILWSGWPQSQVTAVLPFLFWSIERLLQRRAPRAGGGGALR